MLDIPVLLESEQTFYSAIPLSLDPEKENYHQKIIDTYTSNCLIVSLNEIPGTHFQYFDTAIPLFFHKNHNPIIPFTSLLVGPSYTCQIIMKEYFSWAKLDYLVFSSPYVSFTKKKKPLSRSIAKPSPTASVWKKIDIPGVWAQATLSHVSVSCMQEDILKKELRRIFNHPIAVTAVPVPSSETHNEILAWLFAIYSVAIARKIFRTVVCHSSSLEDQHQTWTKKNQASYYPLKQVIEIPTLQIERRAPALVGKSFLVPKRQEHKQTHLQLAHEIEQKILKVSQYYERKYIYTTLQSKAMQRYIGFASEHHFISASLKKSAEDILYLTHNNTYITLSLPFLPGTETQYVLRELISQHFNMINNKVFFDSFSPPFNPLSLRLHTQNIIVNLVHKACLQMQKAKNKKIALQVKDIATISGSHSMAASIEFHQQQFSKKLQLHQINLALPDCFLSRKQQFKGKIEQKLHSALYLLSGTDCLPSNHSHYWNLHLVACPEASTTINNAIAFFLPPTLDSLFQAAISDALTHSNTSPDISFPVMEYSNES